jgi:CRP/FNR family transcriptional regulator, dissimilatory nitrate respiration regulator
MEVGNFSYKAKDVIFKEGQSAGKVYEILNGEVLCLRWNKDRLIPIMIARKGDRLGEGTFIKNGKYNYSAVTLSFTETNPVSIQSFKNEFTKSPTWMPTLLEIMASRFHHTMDLLAENRIGILSEEEFPPALEIELKKLLG